MVRIFIRVCDCKQQKPIGAVMCKKMASVEEKQISHKAAGPAAGRGQGICQTWDPGSAWQGSGEQSPPGAALKANEH